MKSNTGALRYFGRIRNGATPASGNAEYWDGDVLWVTPEDLGKLNGDRISQTKRQVTAKAVRENNLSILPVGSLIISTRAPIGHMAINDEPMAFNQGCRGIIPGDRVYGPFLYYLLKSRAPELNAIANGTTFVELSRDELAAVLVALPPLDTQRQIGRFLDEKTARIDALIEKKRALLDRLAEKRQALITRAVTKGLDPTAPMKPSGIDWLGEIPAHWEVIPLRRMVLLQRGHDLPSHEREAGDVLLVSSAGITSSHSKKISDGPGIVTGRYGTIGEFYFVEAPYWPLNTTLYSREINCFPKFGFRMLQVMSHLFVLNSLKSAVPGVDRNDILSEAVPKPPHDEQVAISAAITKAEDFIGENVKLVTRSIEALEEYRAALITAAVTGQIPELR